MTAVVVVSSDRWASAGTAVHLGQQGITVLPEDGFARADVVVVVEHRVTQEVLSALTGPPCVLVTDGISGTDFLRAVERGVGAVLPLRDVDGARLARAVFDVREGRADFPRRLQGELLTHLRHVRRDVLGRHGLTPTGLTQREADVLAMIADGFDTGAIAAGLAYSERTVKKVLHGVMTRYHLKHRAHAAAFAVRIGLTGARSPVAHPREAQ